MGASIRKTTTVLIAEQGAVGTSYGGWLATRSSAASSTGSTSRSRRVTGGEASPSISKVLERAAIAQARGGRRRAGREREIAPEMARLLRMPGVAANTLEATLSELVGERGLRLLRRDRWPRSRRTRPSSTSEAEGDGVIVKTLVGPGDDGRGGHPMALIAAPGEVIPTCSPCWPSWAGRRGAADDPDAGVELDGQTPLDRVAGPPAVGDDGPVRAGAVEPAGAAARPGARAVTGRPHRYGAGRGIVRDDVHTALAARTGRRPRFPRPERAHRAPPTRLPQVAQTAPVAPTRRPRRPRRRRSRRRRARAGPAATGTEDIPHSRMRGRSRAGCPRATATHRTSRSAAPPGSTSCCR